MRSLLLLHALLLAACAPAAEEAAPAQVDESSDTPAEESEGTATLAGSWRVAEVDGEAYSGFMVLQLFGTSRTIYWDPPCAGLERRYSIDGKEFSANPIPSSSPPILCDIALPEGIGEVFAAIDEADRIEPVEGGGARLSGLRRSLVLMPA